MRAPMPFHRSRISRAPCSTRAFARFSSLLSEGSRCAPKRVQTRSGATSPRHATSAILPEACRRMEAPTDCTALQINPSLPIGQPSVDLGEPPRPHMPDAFRDLEREISCHVHPVDTATAATSYPASQKPQRTKMVKNYRMGGVIGEGRACVAFLFLAFSHLNSQACMAMFGTPWTQTLGLK